jgi:hypothetical protein
MDVQIGLYELMHGNWNDFHKMHYYIQVFENAMSKIEMQPYV